LHRKLGEVQTYVILTCNITQTVYH